MARLTPEEEQQKRELYEKIAPRRRKFIDKIGYDNWDPFQKPFDPIDIRTGDTEHTLQDLVKQFLRMRQNQIKAGPAYSKGVYDMAMGIMNRDDRYRAMYEFSKWYADLLVREGKSINWESK